ncbi:MAG TPA: PIN domain-containing protein [Terriglobales bacterium]|nr:PIN domain-containing protein [Terriglobales bacterium]
MARKLLLVDFENVQQIDLTQLDEQFNVIIFAGAQQNRVPIELVASTQQLGNRVEWQRIEGNGDNALDFQIAYHLGRVTERDPNLRCIVLSKDKGFDPLLEHLRKSGLKCKRIGSMLELNPKTAATNDSNYKRVFELLRKSDKNRPRKRTTLSQHISAMFQKDIPQVEVDRIIDKLTAEKKVAIENGTVTYNF